MNNLKLGLTSLTATQFLVTFLPVAKGIRSESERQSFETLVNTVGQRLLDQYPLQRDDLITVMDALEGTAQAMVDNAMEVR